MNKLRKEYLRVKKEYFKVVNIKKLEKQVALDFVKQKTSWENYMNFSLCDFVDNKVLKSKYIQNLPDQDVDQITEILNNEFYFNQGEIEDVIKKGLRS